MLDMAHMVSARSVLFCLTVLPVATLISVCALVGAGILYHMLLNAARSDDPYHLGLDNKLVKGACLAHQLPELHFCPLEPIFAVGRVQLNTFCA